VHELAITRNIVAIVEAAANGRRVHRVAIEIGRFSGVMPDAVAFCFDIVAEGTILEGAALDISQPEGRARCQDCHSEYVMETVFASCPCGSRRIVRIQGEELNIKAIEIEEAS
jgi:hydrogenase nickel incorporation protein HypA/HybF